MRKLLLTLAAVAFAASIVPSAPAATGDLTPSYVEGISFGEPVRMQYEDPTQIGGPGEPSIKVDSAGTVYTAGVCCVVRAAPAWYSQDGGKSFSYLSSPGGSRELGIGAEGDFIVDDADGVYFSDTWVPSILTTRWSGHGDVYEYTRDTTIAVIPGLDDRPWLAYTHGDLYLYVNHGTHVAVYKSQDGAQTWTESFSTLGRGQRYWTGHVVADRRTGSVYLFGANCELGQMCAASSHDGGETWTEVAAGTLPRGARANFMVAAAVDAAGNVYGTFTDINSSGCDTYLAVSTDRGATWRQFRVNPESGCATFPWVAAGDDGRVALSWYHNPEERHQDQVPPTSEWRLQAAVVTDATSDSPTVTYGTMDRVIHRGPLSRELWDFQQIDVGPDGRFHIAAAEDHEPPCAGTLSMQGSLAAYQNMCTFYVGQTGGPRASLHAADATSVGDVTAAAADGGVSVSGSVSFGRGSPATVLDDELGDAQPSLDLGAGRIVRRNATADDLVLELDVDALPEALWGGGVFAWHLRVGEEQYRLLMRPRPRSFELCKGDECTPVRGDTDAGGDRVVAHVPLSLLGAGPGAAIESLGADSFGVVGSPDAQTIDHADGVADYTVPGATVTARGLDAAGNPIETVADLSGDLSSFTAMLQGAVPGMIEVEACFGGSCATASVAVG